MVTKEFRGCGVLAKLIKFLDQLLLSILFCFFIMLFIVATIFIFVDQRTEVPAAEIYFTIQSIVTIFLIYFNFIKKAA